MITVCLLVLAFIALVIIGIICSVFFTLFGDVILIALIIALLVKIIFGNVNRKEH